VALNSLPYANEDLDASELQNDWMDLRNLSTVIHEAPSRGLVGVFSEPGGEGESRRRPRPGPPLETLRQTHSARRPLGPYGLVSSQLGSMHSSAWKAGTKHFGV
jgi:hypothetical protein